MTATADAERRGLKSRATPLADYLGRRAAQAAPVAPPGPGPHPGVRQRPRRGRGRARDRVSGLRPGRDRRLRRALGRHRCAAEPAAGPVRLNVVGDLVASSWRPVRLTPGTCFSVAAGAPLPAAADVVVPPAWTDQGMAAVEVYQADRSAATAYAAPATRSRRRGARPRRHLRHAGDGRGVRGTGVGHVVVRPSPRVVVIATGDELVDVGRASQPGQVVDANSHALTAAAAEAGAHAYRVGICDDDPEGLRGCWRTRCCGPTSSSPPGAPAPARATWCAASCPATVGQLHRPVAFPCVALGYGPLGSAPPGRGRAGGLPARRPGAALIGFEVLARPVIQLLAGAEPVFRPSVRAHLLETVSSPRAARVPAGVRLRAARRRLHSAAAAAAARTRSPGWPRPTA